MAGCARVLPVRVGRCGFHSGAVTGRRSHASEFGPFRWFRTHASPFQFSGLDQCAGGPVESKADRPPARMPFGRGEHRTLMRVRIAGVPGSVGSPGAPPPSTLRTSAARLVLPYSHLQIRLIPPARKAESCPTAGRNRTILFTRPANGRPCGKPNPPGYSLSRVPDGGSVRPGTT